MTISTSPSYDIELKDVIDFDGKKTPDNPAMKPGAHTVLCIVMPVIAMLAIAGCDGGDTRSEPQTDVSPLPEETGIVGNPVEDPIGHMLELVGLGKTDLARPPYYEEGYSPLCRMPLIDRLAESPFYLHHWADGTSTGIQESAGKGLLETVSYAIRVLNGGVGYPLPKPHDKGLAEAYRHICARHNAQPDLTAIGQIGAAGFSDAFDRQMGAFAASVGDASALAKKAVGSLSREEIAYLSSMPERYFYDDGRFSFLTAPTHTQKRISDIARKIDFVSLFTAALTVSRAVDQLAVFISQNPGGCFKTERRGTVLNVESPIGDIVVLGGGDDTFSGTAAILIDLGGNDTYSGPIATGHLAAGRVSVALDVDGNDTYSHRDDRFAQGFGCLGVGILADLKGDDRYVATDMAQGCGIYGVGLAVDFQGGDSYRMGSMGQGFGVFGLGMLLDRAGDDLYTATALGQGAGSTLGLGLLCDSSGNDRYLADKINKAGGLMPGELCHVQGAGLSIRHLGWTEFYSLYGGIGFLSDKDGNDSYVASHGNCMGSSYFMSLGTLVDHGGNDIYAPQGGFGMGHAVHLSVAALIDRKGDDFYHGNTHTGGVGSDRSAAFMADYEGNDTYGPTDAQIRTQIMKAADKQRIALPPDELEKQISEALPDVSYGVGKKPKAVGFFIDYKGDDRYFGRRGGWTESCGGVLPPANPGDWSRGMLADLSGDDFYYQKQRRDNHWLGHYGHGLHYDAEYAGNGFPGRQALPPVGRLYAKIEDIAGMIEDKTVENEIAGLLSPDLFVRYTAVGKILAKTGGNGSFPIPLLAVSKDKALNRDLMEIVWHLLPGANSTYRERLGALLFAAEPGVRVFAARIAGWRNLESLRKPLLTAMTENDGIVRSNIVWALGKIGEDGSVPRLIDTALTDTFAECRRQAASALAPKGRKSKHGIAILETFLKLAQDSDAILRFYAASGLADFGKDGNAVKTLDNLLRDPDVYVQRAASRALIVNGRKDAVPVFVETLKFPSIDTFENYGRELANELACFCGVDFPKEMRYDHLTWKTWWEENGPDVDLLRNVKIMNEIETVSKMRYETPGIETFTRLMRENPENIVVKNRYVRFCNEWVHFRLLKMANVSESVLERCVRLQTVLCEIEPENAGAKSMLAHLYARLSNRDDAVSAMKAAIKLEPDNSAFRQLLEQYKAIKPDG